MSIIFWECTEDVSLKTEPQYLLTCDVSGSLNLKVATESLNFDQDTLLFVHQKILSAVQKIDDNLKYQLILSIADTLIGRTSAMPDTFKIDLKQANANIIIIDSGGINSDISYTNDVKGWIYLTKFEATTWNGTFSFEAQNPKFTKRIKVPDGRIDGNSISCSIKENDTLTLNFQSNALSFGSQKSAIIIQRNLMTEYKYKDLTFLLRLAVKDRESGQTSFNIAQGEALVSFEQVGDPNNKFDKNTTGFINLWVINDNSWNGTFQFEANHSTDAMRKITVSNGVIK